MNSLAINLPNDEFNDDEFIKQELGYADGYV